MSEIRLVAESLKEFTTQDEELFEGLNKKQKAKVIDLAQGEIDAETVEANSDLIKAILKRFKAAVPGKAADLAHNKRKQLIDRMAELPHHVEPFIKAFAAKATGKKSGELMFTWDPNQKKFNVRIGAMSHADEPGVGGRTLR